MKSVGAQLREARLARGWTPKAAAKATKIKEQQLLLIENEEYNRFAAPAYVRGFVRIYAKTLGLNETKILHELDKVLSAEGDDVYLSSSPVQYLPGSGRKALSPRGFFFFMALAVLAAMFVIAGIRIYTVLPSRKEATAAKPKSATDDIPTAPAASSASSSDEPPVKKAVPVDEPVAKAVAVEEPVAKAEPVATAVAVAPPPAATPVSPATPAAVPVATPVGAENLVVQAHDACFVRVGLVDGDQVHEIFSGTMKAGDEKRFTGDKFKVKLAIPAAVNVIFNGDTYHSDTQVPGEFTLPPAK